MCKYTLTRLTCILTRIAAYERHKLNESSLVDGGSLVTNSLATKWREKFDRFEHKLEQNIRFIISDAKIRSINSFLVAADHCTSLHTICATTITIASGEFHDKNLAKIQHLAILFFTISSERLIVWKRPSVLATLRERELRLIRSREIVTHQLSHLSQ